MITAPSDEDITRDTPLEQLLIDTEAFPRFDPAVARDSSPHGRVTPGSEEAVPLSLSATGARQNTQYDLSRARCLSGPSWPDNTSAGAIVRTAPLPGLHGV